ncbi:DUF4199 domain-containing protein [Aequorivita viscosa]|uniref:DUF4199 domain-containing protein n=1 Tax=Aequorivita viscosa TaxID=797419 RepID=A0A1M6JEG2_9FLAO|nr:DUF4199 domain-containing protein [Aequorivita viscosa]SDX10259.1 Protein of unknown function [Aequorivita viscosa]SHJ45045.1 Protein of unknown function [Aequorivita viscosa]
MENQEPSIKKIALNYGILLALLSIVTQVISYVLDVHVDRPWWLTVLQLVISIGVVVMGLNAFRSANQGYLTLVQALKIGVAISLIAGVIAVLFNYIFMNYIDPDYIQKAMDFSREQMLNQNPDMSQEQIDMAMNMSSKLMTPVIMAAFSLISSLFFGFIISLIAGLILKRNPPKPF